MADAHQVTRMFEAALCEYTGAKYAVAVTSCTTALQLCLHLHNSSWRMRDPSNKPVVEIPRRTYVGVAQAAVNAGYRLAFRDEEWVGEYQLAPSPIWDCARWLRAGMYRAGTLMCLSFHWSKHLSIGQGGAILLDDPDAAKWLRCARFDGRQEGGPHDQVNVGDTLHAYLMPRDAAEGLTRLAWLPRDNAPLPWGPGTSSPYPDLSRIFK